MKIYEKIFIRLKELNMSQSELSRRTGISTSTINDWKKKEINPQADKLVAICKALDMPLVDLLCDEEDKKDELFISYDAEEKRIIECYRNTSKEIKRNIVKYCELLFLNNENKKSNKQKRNVSIIQDIDGNKIVVINDIRFKGKRSINWKDVKEYLKEFVGDFYTIASTRDIVYIGSDLPKEYSGSKYTNNLKGMSAKAKANAATGIPEMVEIAVGKHFRENNENKHNWNARYGWYRYDSRFALPVYGKLGEIERYNIFHASVLIRHANDGKMYLYDVIDIKKETSNPLES